MGGWPFQAKPSSKIMTRSSLPFHSRTSSVPASADAVSRLRRATIEGSVGVPVLVEAKHPLN